MHDRPSLLAARERLASANSERLKLADKFIEKFGRSYADVIWWTPVCPNVAVPPKASATQRAAAAKLAKAFGFSVSTDDTGAQRCCIWLELRPFSPNNAPKGYIIIHSADGTLITASDRQWLDDAVERFIKSCRESNDHWEAPIGVMSNYESNPRVRTIK
jgi:hypothetical protein